MRTGSPYGRRLKSMALNTHKESHFTAGDTVRDVVIGMSDGLTVPFALAAGLSGAVAASGLVVTAGVAEVAAGCIAMGLGGFLAAKGDGEHYRTELAREYREVDEKPQAELREVADIFESFGVPPEQATHLAKSVASDKDRWVKFMMKFELGLDEPSPKRAIQSAFTIGLSYVVGGLIPLSPYIAIAKASDALMPSIVLTLFALAVFGYVKGRFSGANAWRSCAQTVLVGGVAAAVAFGIARLVH